MITPPVPNIGADAVNVADSQIGKEPGLIIEIGGTEFTTTVLNSGIKQPLGAVPITV